MEHRYTQSKGDNVIDEDEKSEETWPTIKIEPHDLARWWTPDPKDLADLESGRWLGRNIIIAASEEADATALASKLALVARSSTHRTVVLGHAWPSLREAKELGLHRLTDPDVLVLSEITNLPQPIRDVLLEVLQQRVGRSTMLVGESEPTIRGFFAEDRKFQSALAPFLAEGRCLVVRSRSATDRAND